MQIRIIKIYPVPDKPELHKPWGGQTVKAAKMFWFLSKYAGYFFAFTVSPRQKSFCHFGMI